MGASTPAASRHTCHLVLGHTLFEIYIYFRELDEESPQSALCGSPGRDLGTSRIDHTLGCCPIDPYQDPPQGDTVFLFFAKSIFFDDSRQPDCRPSACADDCMLKSFTWSARTIGHLTWYNAPCATNAADARQACLSLSSSPVPLSLNTALGLKCCCCTAPLSYEKVSS